MSEVYDFIVVGAGSAGCAVAGRLSEDGRHRVLLLEAGPPDSNPWIHVPLGFTKVFTDARVNWKFESEPVEALGGRVLYQPRGKVLGGSSSINGTVYIRGNPADYDEWRQRGAEGWDWDSVLPLFKKAEDQERGADSYHGTGGPLRVSDMPERTPLLEAMLAAARQAGIRPNPDFNGAEQEGCSYYQFTASRHRRWSSARAYLHDAKTRANLDIVTGALVRRVVLEDGRATGIEFQAKGGLRRAEAHREIVLSGGSYGSPQMLQVSGIGPGEVLRRAGVEVVHELDGVGRNLQDHFNTYVAYRSKQAKTLNDLANSLPRRVVAGARYALFKSGPLANTGVSAGAFVRTDPRLEHPDLQINMLGWSTGARTAAGVQAHPFSGFTMSPVHLKPEGRGDVFIKGSDPETAPAIRFEFLATEYDRAAILHGISLIREITRQPALVDWIEAEIEPGPAATSDEALLDDVRGRAIANYHPVGTCRMGPGPDAVVDSRLRVHGIRALRVADASIMPSITAGNTNAPSIMIGEKAAAMILAED